MSVFARMRSHAGAMLAMTGPALTLGAAYLAEDAIEETIKSKYPPSEGPKYKPGDKVMYQGREYTVEGYSGHQGDTAYNLDMDRGLWITRNYDEAQRYAMMGGNDKGAVATIMHLGRSAESRYSRFDNAHTIHTPKDDHGYTVVTVEPLTDSNNATFKACSKRMVSDLSERTRAFFSKIFS